MGRAGLILVALAVAAGFLVMGAMTPAYGSEQTGVILMLVGGVLGYLLLCMAGRPGKRKIKRHDDDE